MIEELPEPLRPSFKAVHELMQKADELRHGDDWRKAVEARIVAEEAALRALTEAKAFLANATPEDRERVAKVLVGIDSEPGQAPPPGPQDPVMLADRIIGEIQKEIQMLKDALASGVPPQEDHGHGPGPGPAGQPGPPPTGP